MAKGQVEIQGLDNLKQALSSLPKELQPAILRAIAQRPAQRAAALARALFPYGNTGKTARTIGVIKVKDARQPYVEVGFRGQSLGYIYVSAPVIERKKRGSIKGVPWLFHRSGEQMEGTIKRGMSVDISKKIAQNLRKYGYTVR